jgi:hypothetical protein
MVISYPLTMPGMNRQVGGLPPQRNRCENGTTQRDQSGVEESLSVAKRGYQDWFHGFTIGLRS